MITNIVMALGYFLAAYLWKTNTVYGTELESVGMLLLVFLGFYRLSKLGEKV